MPDPVPPPHALPDALQVLGWIDELLQRTRAEAPQQSELRPLEVQLAPIWSRMAGVAGVPTCAMLGIAADGLLSCVGGAVRRCCFVSGVVSGGPRSTSALPLLLSRGTACFGAASVHYRAPRTPPAAVTLKEQTSHRPGAGISDTGPHADTY